METYFAVIIVIEHFFILVCVSTIGLLLWKYVSILKAISLDTDELKLKVERLNTALTQQEQAVILKAFDS